MGRKAADPNAGSLTEWVYVRVSKSQLASLKKAAKKAKVGLTAYVRQAALDKADNPRLPS